MHAPIALFTYNRPKHLRRVLDSLLRNKESFSSDLVVYSDAAKTMDDEKAVTEVRKIIDGLDGFASIKIIKRKVNLGLATSIITGVTDLLRESEKIIVIEDDLILSNYFLTYMNQYLELYERNPSVASIVGYSYPLGFPLPDTFFLRGAACWGWSTWKNKWGNFECDAEVLLGKFNQATKEEFNHYNHFDYFKMLELQAMKKIDSWGIRWHASAFLKGLYSLYPGRSFVHNIGMDGTGVHSTKTKAFDTKIEIEIPTIKKIPIKQDREIAIAVGKHLQSA
jgi:glycosyltransferase involved in cell wall biosynthesis